MQRVVNLLLIDIWNIEKCYLLYDGTYHSILIDS